MKITNNWQMLRRVFLLSIRASLLTAGVLLNNVAWQKACAEEANYSQELPRISPTPASETMASFQVSEGFEMQLVAAEPLVTSPVAIEWDESGAMYVCEMRGYSENREEGISRVARLTDRDGDGVYDSRTEFATGLFWPTGIYPYDGGLFVGDAPDLFYFKDTDGDGISDSKQHVLTGFGTSNVQGLMNSFRWGLDNRVHIACGSVGGEIRVPSASPDAPGLSISGRDLALDPKTYQFEPTSGAAQHGMCFDDWGNKFVSSNSDHIQQVMYEDRYLQRNPYVIPPPSRISIAADGPQAEVYRTSPVEPWRILRTRLRVAGLAKGPIEGGGRAAGYFTGATGITICRGNAWPEQFQGVAIVGDVGGNLIHRKRLLKNGLQWSAERIDPNSEWVTSSDNWFRPAQFANAPDGSLHVIDMYREVIEHPLSLPAEIKTHLDLTSGRDRGRIYRLVPTGWSFRPRELPGHGSDQQLIEWLSDDNAWHRETAARLIYERQDAATVEPLRSLAIHGSSALGRLHALYCLSGLDSLDETVVVAGFHDPHPQIRRHAVRLAEKLPLTERLKNELARLTDDASIDVRYQLAFTLGGWSAIETSVAWRVDALANIARRDPHDRWIAAAILNAIGSESAQLRARLGDDFPEWRSRLDQQIAIRARAGVTTRGKSEAIVSSPVATRSSEAIAARTALVARYRDALSLDGDIDRGRERFKQHCRVCHRVEGEGYEIGPNLATVAARGAETLLTAVLDPNREVNPQYLNYIVATADGRVLTGMITDENATSLTLRRGENLTETVLKIEIEEIRNSGLSIMPEGMEDALDPQAMADLIRYLMQAK